MWCLSYTNMSTCIRTYRYTDIETYKHTDIQISRLTYIHTYLHTYIHTDIQISRLTYIHTNIPTYRYPDLHTYIRTYVHWYMDTWIHRSRSKTNIYIHGSDICGYGHVSLPRWGKTAKAAKGSRKVCEYHYLYEICTRKHGHNSVSRFCWDAKWSRKRGVKAVLGNHNFEQPQITNIHTYIQTDIHTYRHTNIHAYTQTHVHTYIHIYTYMHTCIHAYTVTYLLKLTYPATDRPS